MSNNAQPNWLKIATDRYPRAVQISGNGPYVVFIRNPLPIIRLYESWDAMIVAEPHCHGNDTAWTKLQQPPPKLIRRAHWYRDLED